MGDWLVWEASEGVPSLRPLKGVSESRLHARDYHRASWPAKAACEASADWAAALPDCSVVDGLPLVSEAVAARLQGRGLDFWPVRILQGRKQLTTRFAAIPTRIANTIRWKQSEVTFRRKPHLSPVVAVRRMVLNDENLADAPDCAACINLPNIVFVRRAVAAELEAAGHTGLSFCEPEAFSIAFGETTSAEQRALARVMALAASAGAEGAESAVLDEVADLDADALEDWLDDAWHHHGVHSLDALGDDLGGGLEADAAAAYRSALKAAILARLGREPHA